MNFREELVPLLKNRELIDAEWELVEQIMTVCRRRHRVRRRDNVTAAPRTPRIFNVSYMIVCKTSSVFEVFGTVENALYVAANAMLERFEEIVKTLQQSNGDFGKVDKELSVGFVELVDVYFKCFEEWRAPDSKIFKTRLKWALHAMHEAAAALENDDGETVVGMDIQRETVRLKEYYRKSFGEEALAELEEQLHGGNVVLETYPFRGEQEVIFKRTLSKLAHELLLDPDFRMDVQHMYEERPELRVEYDETFWNQVEEGLRSGADFRGVVQVLKQIKCGLMEVLPAEEWALIDEVIDTPPQGGRWWSECVGLLEGIMHLILKAHQMPASPLREKLTVMWNERVDLASENPRMVCKALEFFLYGIEVSRLDMMNRKLRMLAPGLQQYGGVEFERLNFAEMVTQGMTRLDKTRAWIRRAVAERKSSAMEIEEALLLIVVGDGDGEEIPETFWLDAGRLREQQKEFARQVRMGSFFVTLNGFLDRAGLQDLYKEILRSSSVNLKELKDDVEEVNVLIYVMMMMIRIIVIIWAAVDRNDDQGDGRRQGAALPRVGCRASPVRHEGESRGPADVSSLFLFFMAVFLFCVHVICAEAAGKSGSGICG